MVVVVVSRVLPEMITVLTMVMICGIMGFDGGEPPRR